MPKDYKNKNILIFGDTHLPYHHPKLLSFLQNIKSKFNPERVFHTGDLADQYSFSSYSKLPEAENAPSEIKGIRKAVKEIGKLFPKMTIVSSNHDDRLYKRSRLAGIPKEIILPYKQLVGADHLDWNWVTDYQLRLPNKTHLYIAHHRSSSSLALSKALGVNVVQGHEHTKFGINYTATPHGKLFSVDCGCLIGDNHYAFGYNKQSIFRPVLGCCMIINSHPILIPFDL